MVKPSSVLLAAKASLSKLQFPMLASPKIDGIRAIVVNGVLLSRQFKLIPNEEAQFLFGRPEYEGFDGELIAAEPSAPDVFQLTTSVVMSQGVKCGATRFMVFDDFSCKARFAGRLKALKRRVKKAPRVELVQHVVIDSLTALNNYEAECITQGYEGVMLRHPGGVYKEGRSTEREGILLKLKRFQDAEAAVVGYEEEKKADGRHGTLGALRVRDVRSGVEFSIGSGFTAAEREDLWNQRRTLKHRVVKYRFFHTASKGKPRFPTFLGWRLDI